MNREKIGCSVLVVAFGIAGALAPIGTILASSDTDEALEWMVPKICADKADKPANVDPYGGCPEGTQLRQLAPGDPLPYRRMDLTRQQYKDVYPRVSPDGSLIVVATFDWVDPKSAVGTAFKIASDGYDAYEVREGWASVSETRNGTGEYGTTFMGDQCKNYNGLIFFPTDFVRAIDSPGSATLPIFTVPWESDAEQWPGECPKHYVSDQITSWKLLRNFPFGGMNGVPRRNIDAIVTTTGLRRTKDPAIMKQWEANAHLEVFYFTKMYGVTRWERFEPEYQFEHDARNKAGTIQQSAANAVKHCMPGPGMSASPFRAPNGGSATRISMTYEDRKFVMTDCRDWSRVILQEPVTQAPAWPVSALNLLRNFHFNGAALNSIPDWDTSNLHYAASLVSTTKDDTTKDTLIPLRGVTYLKLGCANGECTSDSLYQDIAVSPATRTGLYTIGVIARSESGEGSLLISLSQLERSGAVLSTSKFRARDIAPEAVSCNSAGENCESFGFDSKGSDGSVILSSGFYSDTLSVTIEPTAYKLRFSIAPQTNRVFDLVSAWLMAD